MQMGRIRHIFSDGRKELWDNNAKENPVIPEWFLSDWALGHASVDEDKDPLGNPVKKETTLMYQKPVIYFT